MLKENLLKNEKIKPNSREIELLRQNFPQFFSKEGEFLLEKFKEMLKMDDVKIDKEGYELKFLGKNYARFLTSIETETVIVPNIKHNEEEINKNSENLYIIGDNLDALKHLLNSYSGKIKCIYIDPPYNTGSDGFVYNDNFEYTAENISEKMGIELEEAQRIIDMRGKSTHSAWLTFMYPRLVLARDLLREDGVIFISIDDNEQANLKMVCDEIFGEENFIASITRNTNSSKNQSLYISVTHEYCLVYSVNNAALAMKYKNNKWEVEKNNISEYKAKVNKLKKMGISNKEITEELKELTNYPRFIDFTNYWYFDEKGLYQKADLGGVKNGNNRPLINPLTQKEDPVPPGGFRYSTEKLEELQKDNRIHFHTDGSLPRLKRYLDENLKQRPKSIMSDDQRPDYKLLKSMKIEFNNPKQMTFMKRILSIFDKNLMILDFFSGSATTAHAVMQLNAEDGGNRKYIMVQLPEKTYEEKINKEGEIIFKAKKGSEAAYKAGYKTIDEIGIERIKRAAKKIKKETQAEIDYGFKIVKLETPNSNTLDKIVGFNPDDNKLILDNFIDEFKFGETEGYDTILTTWLNQDGYGMNVKSQKVLLKNFEIDVFENSAYVIKEGISSEDVMELITRVEKNEIAITRLVVYPYSVSFNVLHEMKKNFKNLRGNKELKLIERY